VDDETATDAVESSEPVEQSAPPDPVALSDDGYYIVEEGKDPLTGADLRKGYALQSDYTRKTQALAEQRRAFEQQQQQYQQELQQYVANLQAQYQQAMQQGQQQPQQGDPLDAIWQAAEGNGGLITVAEAKQLVKAMQSQLGQPQDMVVEAIRQLNNRINQVSAPLSEMLSAQESRKLDNMVTSFLSDSNVPQEMHETAKDIFLDFYRANEPTPQEEAAGQTMESMFQDFAKGRLESILKMADGITKSQASAAQAKLGRQGGVTAPSNSLKAPMTTEEIMARVNPQFPSR